MEVLLTIVRFSCLDLRRQLVLSVTISTCKLLSVQGQLVGNGPLQALTRRSNSFLTTSQCSLLICCYHSSPTCI